MPPDSNAVINGITIYSHSGDPTHVSLPSEAVRVADVDAINAHIREQGIEGVVCRFEDNQLVFTVPQEISWIRLNCDSVAYSAELSRGLMCYMLVDGVTVSVIITSTSPNGGGVPSFVRGIRYPTNIQGAAEINEFLQENRIEWLRATNNDGLLNFIYTNGHTFSPRQGNRATESEFMARYGIPNGVCEFMVSVDLNSNTHIYYSYPREVSTVLAWFPVNPSDGDTIRISYYVGPDHTWVRYDRANGRWNPAAPNDGVLYRRSGFRNPRVSYTLNDASRIYPLYAMEPTAISNMDQYHATYGSPYIRNSGSATIKRHRPKETHIEEAYTLRGFKRHKSFETYLELVLEMDSKMENYSVKKAYPTYIKEDGFNNQTYRAGNLPARLTSTGDIENVISAYKTLTPSIFRNIRKKMSIGVSTNTLFSNEKARKFPMHPIVTEDGIQFKVMDDWHYFFFKGGAVPTDVNLKFIAFPIFEKEEWFLHEATKKNRFDMCQEHDLIAYKKAAGTNQATVQGHVFDSDIVDRTRFWTIKSKYVKLFVSDKYKGRKYICNFYFELSDTIDSEIITVKHLTSDYTFATSGRLLDSTEVFENLAPNPQSRPFIRSSIDPEYQGYIKSCFTFKRPKFVFKAKGRKLGNLKGVCQ